MSTKEESTTAGKVDFKKLQNGSDIRGVAVAGVEGEPVNLTEETTVAIAAAFAAWLVDKKNLPSTTKLRIAIGHDSRISAASLQAAAAKGILGAGLDVVLYGLASTPAMFNSTITEREDILCPVHGAIMITASHLPWNRNGLKFFTNEGGLGKSNISDILTRAAKIFSENPMISIGMKEAQKINYMQQYTADLVNAVRRGAGGKGELADVSLLRAFLTKHIVYAEENSSH
jgi:phosphomannomutase